MFPLLEISNELLPEVLSSRNAMAPITIATLLFGSFVLLALARYFNPGIYFILFTKGLKTYGIRTFLRETLPLSRTGSILLVFNYLISATAIMMLWITSTGEVSGDLSLNPLTGIPLVILLWNTLCILLGGWITGELDSVLDAVVFKIIGAQSIGVLYFIIGLIWVLNPQWSEILWQITVAFFLLETTLRILKSYFAVIASGMHWYYLILYLCTLEILPLFVAYRLLMV